MTQLLFCAITWYQMSNHNIFGIDKVGSNKAYLESCSKDYLKKLDDVMHLEYSSEVAKKEAIKSHTI